MNGTDPREIAENYFKHIQKGQLLMEVARWREALHEFQQHLLVYPDSYTVLCQSAICRMHLEEYQSAFDTTKAAIAAEPEVEWAYRIQSLIFTKNGEPKRALDAAKIAVEKAPDAPETIQCLFWTQANSDDIKGAAITLPRLLERIPDSAGAHEAAGFLAAKLKKHPEAETHYLEALRIDPESVLALNNLGVVYLEYARTGKGQHYQQKAVEMFERAVRTKPEFELGQQNMSTASSAFKIGAPAGIGFLIWMALRMSTISGSISNVDPMTAGASFLSLNPITSNPVLTALNLYSLALFIAAAVLGFACFSDRYRKLLIYEFLNIRGWLVTFCLFAFDIVSYLVIFRTFDIDPTPRFSGFSASIAGIITIFAGANLFRHWSARRATI